MRKQWTILVVIGVMLVAVVVGWDLYLTFAGLKGDFSYTIISIDNFLYLDVDNHFRTDPDFRKYEQEAIGVNSIDFFN